MIFYHIFCALPHRPISYVKCSSSSQFQMAKNGKLLFSSCSFFFYVFFLSCSIECMTISSNICVCVCVWWFKLARLSLTRHCLANKLDRKIFLNIILPCNGIFNNGIETENWNNDSLFRFWYANCVTLKHAVDL